MTMNRTGKWLIAATLTLLSMAAGWAQGKLIWVHSEDEAWRKENPQTVLYDQEKTRLLMPQGAAFGVECIPSFSTEWTLTYDSVARALVYREVGKSLWHATYRAWHTEAPEGLCGTSRENRLAPRQQRPGVDAAGRLDIGLPRCRGPRGVNPGRNEVGVLHRRTAGQVAPRGKCTRQLCQRPEGSRRYRQCESQRLTHRQRVPAGSGQSDSRRQAAPQEQRLHRRHHQRTAAARLPVPVNQPQTQAVLLPTGRTGHP